MTSFTVRCGGLAVVAALVGAGCAPADEEERTGEAEEAALTANALTANALTANALTQNALTQNALTANAMNADTLEAIQDPGPDGDLARQLLRYMVSCAFRGDQQFDFTWTDATGAAHDESYPGQIGLAPTWATQPLDWAGRHWISACLAARVNALGVTVPLSVRGAHPALATTPAEVAAYPTREAVFFGDLFSPSPRVYACYDPTTTLFSDLESRLCAQPSIDLRLGGLSLAPSCGPIQVLGPCYQLLGLLNLGYCANQDRQSRYFYNCLPSPPDGALPAITTFLQGPL